MTGVIGTGGVDKVLFNIEHKGGKK